MSETGDPEARPETGPMKFGSDWTGVFIRGDNAFYYAHVLEELLDHAGGSLRSPFARIVATGLVAILRASSEHTAEPDPPQRMRPFVDCVAGEGA